MNKNAIKKFAIDARNKLIASVTDKAGMLGITASGISDAITRGRDFEVYKTSAGTEVTLNRTQSEQRRRLVAQIEARGFEAVIEEVAYTWFNRICAIRFMEVNDYLPVRVLSSIKDGKTEPDIVTNAPDVDMEFSDAEKSFILEAKVGNKLDELFKMLFIKQCHELNDILPELFEKTEDYTEMLLNISYTNEDDVIRMLVDTVDEKDFNVTTLGEDGKPTGQVEIIGWLYQYYNTELKDDTFAKLKKNVKITKERIPAATQLFTPDWIVRYMVENSVGRIWIEHLRAVDPSVDEKATAENFGWKYYLPETEQEEAVNVKLAEIRTSYANLKPEDITCIDPCMGSGHILIAMFDVLMDIYKSTGYSEKEAAFSIVENNIHGLDIDKRAYQLAYFAVMMKGRGYNRRFFRGHDDMKPQPKVYAIQESNGINRVHIKYFGVGLSAIEKNNALNQINGLLDVMADAKEYGSILNVDNYDWDLLRRFTEESGEDNQLSLETIGIDITREQLISMISIGAVLAKKYDAVITNPPYMGANGMDVKLTDFMVNNYPETKYDLSTAMMERSFRFANHLGYIAMINIPVWMFLSSYEKLRRRMLDNCSFTNMAHFGRGVFGSDFGTTAFVVRNKNIKDYLGYYKKLYKRQGAVDSLEEKLEMFFSVEFDYHTKQEDFYLIPGYPIAYWVKNKKLFTEGEPLEVVANPRQGLKTLDNERFLRNWYEVDFSKINLEADSLESAQMSGKKWFPINHGGEFHKYYGNNCIVVNWENDGSEMKQLAIDKYKSITRTITNMGSYFKEGITWTVISSASTSFRRYGKGFIFSNSGQSIVPESPELLDYLTGFLNTKIVQYILAVLSPTLGFESGYLKKIAIRVDERYRAEVENLTREAISIAKEDWDSFETSWDFSCHPFIKYKKNSKIEDAFEEWKKITQIRYSRTLEIQKRLNEIFIEIYGLEGELSPEIDDRDMTLAEADRKKDAESFLSYLVGCILGRYSLRKEGIVYAGGNAIESLIEEGANKDNVIVITDEEYLSSDIVVLVSKYIEEIYGRDSLNENLKYIADSLEIKGTSAKDVIRKYFQNDFYKNHCSQYSFGTSGRRPIYWLFDSGKQNGFKCLSYIHRYNPDLVGTIRTEYLHVVQNAIEQALTTAEHIRDNSSNGTDKSTATRNIALYSKQLLELQTYDEAMAHVANQRIVIDLDDGIKTNYSKFQGIEISQEGKKALKIDLLSPIK